MGIPVRNFLRKILNYEPELRHMLSEAHRFCAHDRERADILDAGCGYGRIMSALEAGGFRVTGVDANPGNVDHCKKQGLAAMTVDEFKATRTLYDFIIMSHVIEHMQPAELLNFLDFYMDRLKTGGYLLISTPLMHPGFYDDFDHVKPYNVFGLMMAIGEQPGALQYRSRNVAALVSLKYRRRYFRFFHNKHRHLRTPVTLLIHGLELISALLALASFGVIARKDGWTGVFKKIGPRN